MALLVAIAQVLSDKRSLALRKIATVDLLRSVIQLMAVAKCHLGVSMPQRSSTAFFTCPHSQMLSSGVALATVWFWAPELLVQSLTTALTLPRRSILTRELLLITLTLDIALGFGVVFPSGLCPATPTSTRLVSIFYLDLMLQRRFLDVRGHCVSEPTGGGYSIVCDCGSHMPRDIRVGSIRQGVWPRGWVSSRRTGRNQPRPRALVSPC
jgi:hypothetical protein